MTQPPTLSAAARLLLQPLLWQYARAVAHEANNLLFLDEIAAKTGKRGPDDSRRGLSFVQKQARVLSLALAPEAKRGVTKLADLSDDLVEAVTRQSSLRKLLQWDMDESARAYTISERPAHAQILLHHLIEQALGQKPPEGRWRDEAALRVQVLANEDGIDILLTLLQQQSLPPPTSLAREICALNAFGLESSSDGASTHVWLPLGDSV